MNVLVAYATRHGATRGIAERIADMLRDAGLEVDLADAAAARQLERYDAFVIGSAAYMFHWLKPAVDLVRHNRTTLAVKPVWLFSSGPVGPEPFDAKGQDQKVAAIPREIEELRVAIGARGHAVFFGAFIRDRKPVGLAERFLTLMPAGLKGLPEGDFRDWPEIEAWAASIAADLRPVAVG